MIYVKQGEQFGGITISSEGGYVYSQIPLENVNIKGDYQFELLKKAPLPFMKCTKVSKEKEYLRETCELSENSRPLSNLKWLTESEKRLLLLNVGKSLDMSGKKYITYISPDNIYFSDSYEIFFAFRLSKEMVESDTEISELDTYKALILSVLQKKYTFDKLLEVGIDVLDKDTNFQSIIECQNLSELLEILKDDYSKNYRLAKVSRMGFPVKFVKIATIAISVIVVGLIISLVYFAYRNITQTDQYEVRMNIYESFYARRSDEVVEYAEKIEDDEMDLQLKLVVADALIAVGTKEEDGEMLERAFYLDEDRQVECILMMVDIEDYDRIASLHSSKNKIQLYQAFYAKDYDRAITLCQQNLDLKYDAQAQILLSRAYANMGQFLSVEQILDGLGDIELQLEIYKLHREDILKNDTNIKSRQEYLPVLNEIIRILEEQVKEG